MKLISPSAAASARHGNPLYPRRHCLSATRFPPTDAAMTSLATVASFATPAASTRGHPSTTRRAPWRRPVSRGTTVVTRAATAEELEERLRQKEDQIHELRNELDLQARSISHWFPYDRAGVVNADP